jgi:hypothetical protein
VRRIALKALGRLDPATLAQHSDAVVARLDDSEAAVRKSALETLAALEPTALCHYAAALGMRAKDADEGVREVALAMLRSLKGHVDLSETQSKLDPLELEEYSSAIIASLADFDEDALTGDVDLESRDASSQRLGDTDIGAGSVYEKQLIDLMFPRSF